MLTHHEETAADEPPLIEVDDSTEIGPLPDRDPAIAARLREAGVRLATGSLDRPRRIAERRPAWVGFLLRAVDTVGTLGRRLFRLPPRNALETDDLAESDGAEKPARSTVTEDAWPRREVDPEMGAWLRSMRIRPATHSLDHPRQVMKQRPAWLAYLVNHLKVWG